MSQSGKLLKIKAAFVFLFSGFDGYNFQPLTKKQKRTSSLMNV